MSDPKNSLKHTGIFIFFSIHAKEKYMARIEKKKKKKKKKVFLTVERGCY